jgi:glycoside/pentoside/hexuronide:cation symporter, GPH family
MAKKLPFWGQLLYGAGAGGWAMIDRLMITWLITVFIIKPLRGAEPLVPAMAFGLVMFFGRVVDAIADPLISRWSDNFQGRLGRRTPFMLVSGVFYTAVFIALFYPLLAGDAQVNLLGLTVGGGTINSVVLAVLLGLYFILFTAYVCPYLALLPELARSNKDRVDLSTWKAAFTILGVGAAFIIGAGLAGSIGFYPMLWVMGGAGLVLLYLPVLIREKVYSEAKPATLGLVAALKTTFQNRPFTIYLAANVSFWLGFNIITLNVLPYVLVLLGGTEDESGLYMAVAFGVAMLGFILVNVLAKKLGLKAMMMFSMIAFMVILPFFFFLGRPLLSLSPETIMFILMALVGLPMAGLFVVPDAIVAAVSDLEEKLSGQRREAMYFGAQGFVLKVALGLSTLITTGLFHFFGSTAEQPLGIQLTGPVAALFILAGVIVFTRYPEKEVVAFRQETVRM